MKNNPCFRIGHLKIADHLIAGCVHARLNEKQAFSDLSDIKITAMNSWVQVCDALRHGDINAAFISAPLAMELFAAGLDIKILMFTHRSGSIMVKSKTADIKGLGGFRGKTILIPSEFSIQAMLVHRLLASAGLRPGTHDDDNADVTWQAASPALMPEMLMNDQTGEIAGFVVAEPFATRAVQQGTAVKLFTSHSLWKNHPCCVFVMDTFFTQYYPEAVKELIGLFVESARMLEASKTGEPDLYIQHFLDTDTETAAKILSDACICFDPSLLVPDINIFTMIHEYMKTSMGMTARTNELDCLVDRSIIAETISEGSV